MYVGHAMNLDIVQLYVIVGLSCLSYSYTVSQADVAVFEALSGAPKAELCNALRWYNQLQSYKSQFSR